MAKPYQNRNTSSDKSTSLGDFALSAIILLLFIWVLICLAFRLPFVQNALKNQLISWVNKNFDQDIQVDQMSFDLAAGIEFKLLIRDHHQDTLIFADRFGVRSDRLLGLVFQPELLLQKITGDRVYLNIKTYTEEEESNLQVFVKKFKKGPASEQSFKLMLQTMTLTNLRASVSDVHMDLNLNLDKLYMRMDSIDLGSEYFHFRSLVLDRPIANIFIKQTHKGDKPYSSDTADAFDELNCKLGPALFFSFVNCNHGSISYSDTSRNRLNHFSEINFSATYTYFSQDLLRTEFLTLNANGDRGFKIKDLHVAGFNYNPYEVSVEKFQLKTDHSKVSIQGKLQAGSTTLKETDLSDWITTFRIENTSVSPLDLAYFPSTEKLLTKFNFQEDVPLNLTAQIVGTPKSLSFKEVHLNYGKVFSVLGMGQVRNILSGTDALINFKFKSSQLNSDFLYRVLNNPSIPASYKKLGNIRFAGNFDGFISDFVAFGKFDTDLGSIRSDIKVALKKDISKALYSGSVTTTQFNLGQLLDIPQLGNIHVEAGITEGKGLTKESIDATFTAHVKSVEFNKRQVKELKFNGTLKNDHLKGQLQVDDDRLMGSLNGELKFNENEWTAQIKSNIKNIQLGLFNEKFSKIQLSGNFIADLKQQRHKETVGTIKGDQIVYSDSSDIVRIGNLSIEQHFQQSLRTLRLESNLLSAQVIGFFDIATIGNDILGFLDKKHKHFISNFYKSATSASRDIVCNANLYIKEGHELNKILKLPFIAHLLDFDLVIDSKKDLFEIKSNRFDLIYKNYMLDKMSFSIRSTEMLKFLWTFDYLKEKNKNRTGNGKVLVQLGNGDGNLHLQLFDQSNKYILTNLLSNIQFSNEHFSLNLQNQNLYFNDRKWSVHVKNLLQFKKEHLSIQNLELTDSVRFIGIRDFDNKGLVLNTDGFSLDFVNQLLKSQTVHFEGIFSSTINIPDLKNLKFANGEINIVDFKLNKSHFGPLKIQFDVPDEAEPWNINLTSKFRDQHLLGRGNLNIPLSKNYTHEPFDFDVLFDLKQFPMSFLENFIESISNSTGGGDGIIRFYSEKNKLNLEGKINITQASSMITYLGVPVQIFNQTITLHKKSIEFNQTQMKDKLGNPLTVNGFVYHTNLKDWGMDIRVRSDKALVLETDKSNKEDYYGYGIGNVDAQFTGPVSQLQMDVNLISTKGTKLFLPMTISNETERAEFVKFVDRTKQNVSVPKNSVSIPSLTGLNVNMQLTLTDDAEVSVIFDEQTGDILKGKGRGNLQIKSLRNGLFTVNGDFEVEQGQYLFTLYNFVNKPFTLTRGGTAVWTGDPLNANINIEAVYEGLQAAPYLLLQEYLGENQDLIEEAKRRTAVKLKMLLTGSLLKPTITFDLELPDLTGSLKNYAENKIGYLKLNQDQFNQQIFGLLVLGSFLNNTNPWEGGLVGNLGTTTINTMSEMLSNQFSLFVTNLLNNAFDDVNFISGIDFNIGYDIDNTNVGGTNLNETEVVFSLKHRLWNDQWIITLGGNYKSNSQLLGNSYFNPESVIEWNTPVQGLKMRVYYRGDESIEGIKHKIGAGVSIRKEFDRIFSGNSKTTK
ncbi:MAG: translocation/assembly module TamB domain-containing protein [Saprospiraceae bacterium]|nr:translocation/assembly module TamB domain-containing protein [Saprospiraceae bacterium]